MASAPTCERMATAHRPTVHCCHCCSLPPTAMCKPAITTLLLGVVLGGLKGTLQVRFNSQFFGCPQSADLCPLRIVVALI